MLPIERERLGQLTAVGHGLAWLLIVLPLLEVLARSWPLQPHLAAWRFSSATFFMNTLTTPLLGLGIGCALAAWSRRRASLTVYGAVTVVLGAFGALWIAVFGLDALQTRAQVEPEALREFDVMALKTLVAGVLNVAVALWLGLSAWRAARVMRLEAAATAADRSARIVVGR